MRRGQIFSLDLLLGFSLFLVLLISAFSLSRLSQERTHILSDRAQMQEKANLALLTLLLHTGDPENWYKNTTFQTLGLSSTGDSQVDVQKLQGISQLNTTTFKDSLGLREYSVFLNVTDHGAVFFSFGDPVNSSAKEIVHLERVVSINRTVMTLYLEVWNA